MISLKIFNQAGLKTDLNRSLMRLLIEQQWEPGQTRVSRKIDNDLTSEKKNIEKIFLLAAFEHVQDK